MDKIRGKQTVDDFEDKLKFGLGGCGPVCLVRLGGHLIREDKNEGGRQMAAMERTVGLPAKLL